MIIFFGPPGAGKSVQGQLLAARHGWRWLSTGQILRETDDPRIHEIMAKGDLVGDEDMKRLVEKVLASSSDILDFVLDGFPRNVEQAQWLVETLPKFERKIHAIVSLDVPTDELLQRLHIRGRTDDTVETLTKRTELYHEKTEPVLDYFRDIKVPVLVVDGEGSVGTIHDRVQKSLEPCLQA